MRDVATFLDCHCPGRWFAHWGTALGAIRDSGLIPYDFDCDVVVLTAHDSENSWPLLHELRKFIEHKGHALYNAGRTCIKVHPPRPHVRSIYTEHMYRAAEESKRENLRWPLHKLASVAKTRKETGAPLLRVGRNVVDIEFGHLMGKARETTFKVPGLKGGVLAADLLPTRLVLFGTLLLPVPRNAEDLLQRLYPMASESCLTTRRYKSWTGSWRDVPADIDQRALPSMPL